MPLARLVGIVAGFGLVIILIGGAAVAWFENQRLLRDAASQAGSTAFFLADHAGRLFEVSDVAMGQASQALGARDWTVIEQDRALHDQLKITVQALPYVEDVWLNDETGRLRLTSLAFPAPPSEAADRLSFRLVQPRESGFVVGDLIVGRLTHRATFLLARRLSWPDGSFRGMVSATAEIGYFDDYWRRLGLPYEAQVSLRRSGTDDVLASFPATAPASDVITAERLVGELPLVLRVSFSRAAVSDAWQRWLESFLPIAMIAFLALFALSLLGFQQARREVDAAKAVARARAQLAEANAGLEETVARRTAELRQANEEVQQFAYLVSHDLRAPLVNVLGFTREVETLGEELLAARTAPPSEARWAELKGELAEAIAFIRAGSTKMDRLLTGILKLARDGKRVLRPEPVDMTALLRTLAQAVQFQTTAARAAIDVQTLPAITADRLALEQVFGNLLDNAVKYLDPARPGVVTVHGRTTGDQVVVEVADNGCGITPAEQLKVFDLFRRVGTLDRPGDGIGLSHVRSLVRSMGGQIDLTSQPGVGSVFSVTLPRCPQATSKAM